MCGYGKWVHRNGGEWTSVVLGLGWMLVGVCKGSQRELKKGRREDTRGDFGIHAFLHFATGRCYDKDKVGDLDWEDQGIGVLTGVPRLEELARWLGWRRILAIWAISDERQSQVTMLFTCVVHVRTGSTLISIIVALLERVQWARDLWEIRSWVLFGLWSISGKYLQSNHSGWHSSLL